MKNAGKHAGAGSEILVRVDHIGGPPRFPVTGDGPGSNATASAGLGTMRECLGGLGTVPEVPPAAPAHSA